MNKKDENIIFHRVIAAQISEDLAEDRGKGCWNLVKPFLKSYTWWSDCISVLGYKNALKEVHQSYIKQYEEC